LEFLGSIGSFFLVYSETGYDHFCQPLKFVRRKTFCQKE
jgi:hypothetical protein